MDISLKLEKVLERRNSKTKVKANSFNNIRDYVITCLYYSVVGQSYGAGVEKIIINKHKDWKKDKSPDGGDLVAGENLIEIKFSCANPKGKTNFVQIRPHYKANMYLLMYYSAELDKLEAFLISKHIMKFAIKRYGGYAHGSKGPQGAVTLHSIHNKSYEYAIRPNINKQDGAIGFFRRFNLFDKEEYKWMKKIILS
jgi:hypothetical protein